MEDRSVTNTPEGTTIDVPHEPDAEAALLQECRERIGHLKSHVSTPDAVGGLESIDSDLEALMFTVAETDEYGCGEFNLLPHFDEEVDGETLRERALERHQKAWLELAVSLAVDDGVMTGEEAEEFVEMDELERMQSDLYPGDDYFDRASLEMDGWK